MPGGAVRPHPCRRAARNGSRTLLVLPAILLLLCRTTAVSAQEGVLELTLERMVDFGLRDSYGIRRLQLGIERTRSLLRAEQAGL